MAEYQVLHGEPRHRVDEFRDEMLGRARKVIIEMGSVFERLLIEMIAAFHAFQQAHYLITLKDVRFEWIRWLKDDGQLLIEFSTDQLSAGREVDAGLRHVVIDEFVDGVVGRTVPEELRGEFSQFVRGMVTQFAILEKHSPLLDLRKIAFDHIRWVDDRRLAIRMTHRGQPFVPQEVHLT